MNQTTQRAGQSAPEHSCQVNPRGYIEWHAMAKEFARKKVRQTLCPTCHRWKFPNEECAERMVQRMEADG